MIALYFVYISSGKETEAKKYVRSRRLGVRALGIRWLAGQRSELGLLVCAF